MNIFFVKMNSRGDKNSSSNSESSSSSTSSENDVASKLRNRKRQRSCKKKTYFYKKQRKEVESEGLTMLSNQVSEIQRFLANAYPPMSYYPPGYNSVINGSDIGAYEAKDISVESIPSFNFDLSTNLKEPPIPKTSPEHLNVLNSLQHFNTENWRNVRYVDIQKCYKSRPGFTELNINDEIRYSERSDLILAERSLSAITHALIMQGDALKKGVSELLQWSQDSEELNKESLLSKIKDIFAGDFQKVSLDCLQLVCGRRADVIEHRRDLILTLVKDPCLKSRLKQIPPSCEHLFEKEKFSEFLKINGGINKIFSTNKPFAGQEKRIITAPQAVQPRPSTSYVYNETQTGRHRAPFGMNYNKNNYFNRYVPPHMLQGNNNFSRSDQTFRFQSGRTTSKNNFRQQNQSNSSRSKGRGDKRF